MRKMDNSSSHSMDMMRTTNITNGNLVLVNMDDYETAQLLSSNIKDQFSTQLRPRSLVNETTNLDTLEISLEKLGEAVNVKALPEAMMDIVTFKFTQCYKELMI